MALKLLEYLGHRGTHSLHPGGRGATSLLLEKLPSTRGRLLEFGCGTGHSLIASTDQGWRVTGVDVSPIMLRQARKRLRAAGTRCGLARIAPTGALPFADAAFDSAYCESVLAILQPEQFTYALAQIRRVLVPGGVFVVNEGIWSEHTPAHAAQAFNAEMLDSAGLMTAPHQLAGFDSWALAFERAGFVVNLVERIPARLPRGAWTLPQLRSRLFSLRMQASTLPRALRTGQRAAAQALESIASRHAVCLESYMFVLSSSG
jgi:SAM-dependent methyltransferase